MLTGIPAAQNWVKYHGEKGGYDVAFSTDPSTAFRGGADPRLFRYQVQGPQARELVETVFGGPLPPSKFFHSVPVALERPGVLRAPAQHGRPGRLRVHRPLGARRVREGHAAYRRREVRPRTRRRARLRAAPAWRAAGFPRRSRPSTPTPDLADYRAWLPLFGIEGQRPLNGSFYSDDIEDYYVSPWELGYGRSISFNHDFIGRDALLAGAGRPRRASRSPWSSTRRTCARCLGDGPRLLPHLRQAPGRTARRAGNARRPHPPDGHPGHRRHDPGADAHQQGARRAGHRGHGHLGRAPRRGHRHGCRPRLPADPGHGRARALRRVRSDAIPAPLTGA